MAVESGGGGLLAGVGDGGGAEIDADAAMPQGGEALGIEPWPAAQNQDAAGAAEEQCSWIQRTLPLDQGGAAAGGVVALAEVLGQQALGKAWLVPGDYFRFGPGLGDGLAVEEVE